MASTSATTAGHTVRYKKPLTGKTESSYDRKRKGKVQYEEMKCMAFRSIRI